MAEQPLLLFPTPETADRTMRQGFPGSLHRPTHRRQGQRIAPILIQLQEEFNARRVELQTTTAGIDPEQVLVIEIIGNIENFANAVRLIDGLEWLGEIETDEIAPDTDFYDESDENRTLKGRLYLVMTNQRPLEQLLSLWRRYQNDPTMTFERGLTRFRDIFLYLKDIRRWGIQDRIEETGLLDAWREDLEHDGDQAKRLEIELWFRNSHDKQESALERSTN